MTDNQILVGGILGAMGISFILIMGVKWLIHCAQQDKLVVPTRFTTVTIVPEEKDAVCRRCGKTDFKANLVALDYYDYYDKVVGIVPMGGYLISDPDVIYVHAECGNLERCPCGKDWIPKPKKKGKK